MTSLIEVWESREGVAEIRGAKHNALILQWWKDAGHDEIIDDDTAWCSGSMCSAAKAAGLPFPPRNVNTMARSWLSWGRRIEADDVQTSDVIIWPRGNPSGPYGHVNCVKEVRRRGKKIEVRCIGGNQSHKSGGAVTTTDWLDIRGALKNGVRRAVPATVKDLRAAGSTEIKAADILETVAVTAPVVSAGAKLAHELTVTPAPVVPDPSLTEQLKTGAEQAGFIQTLMETGTACAKLIIANPWMPFVIIVSGAVFWLARKQKRARVVRAAKGVPLSQHS